MNTSTPSLETPLKQPCDVLLAVDAYMPWSGGSRIYYENLYRRLSDWHHLRVRVETSHCDGDDVFDKEFSPELLRIRRDGTRLPDWKVRRAPLLARKIMRIARAVSEYSPAAIHCGDLFPQDFAGMLLKKLGRVPFLVFVHGDEVSQTQHRRLQPHLRNAIYRAADSVVAANRFAYDRVVDILGSRDRVTMITPGVDTKIFHPGPRPAWIRDQYQLENDPLIVTVGRLVKKKGHETVLRSLPIVLKSQPMLKYLVVGDGPERKRLEMLTSELGLGACVRFAGNVPNYSVGDFYRAADIFCLLNQEDETGDIESFGMVFVEAGATAKPVIGGRSGGTGQSVVDGQTGMLCEPGNAVQLAESLNLLLSCPDLARQMGEAGLARARRDFCWESRAEQLLEVHQSITRATPRSAGGSHLCFQR
jgi:phosphatidyl-myo-inositol dimannoside synthase